MRLTRYGVNESEHGSNRVHFWACMCLYQKPQSLGSLCWQWTYPLRAFDVLVRVYEDYGCTAREAAVSIVQNNLWGLDINDRAAQLAYFAVMMKARQYDRRFFSKGVQPHVYGHTEL